jgi:aspartyl/glutamyl-tRNA(Asn/Gln) amidotransferase C subunit
MDKDKVSALAKLARIEISEGEASEFAHEFEAILGYVGEVRGIIGENAHITPQFAHKNILREDKDPHEGGVYTKQILEQAPLHDEKYIKVKKIL